MRKDLYDDVTTCDLIQNLRHILWLAGEVYAVGVTREQFEQLEEIQIAAGRFIEAFATDLTLIAEPLHMDLVENWRDRIGSIERNWE